MCCVITEFVSAKQCLSDNCCQFWRRAVCCHVCERFQKTPSVTDTNWLPVPITVQAPPASGPQTSRTNPEGIKIVNVINKSQFYGSYLAIISYYTQDKFCYMCWPSEGVSFAYMYLLSLFSVCLIAMFAVLLLLKMFPPFFHLDIMRCEFLCCVFC